MFTILPFYFFTFLPLLFVMLLMCQTDEHRTQHREHVSLYECHQQFEGVHEQQHDDAEQVQADTHANTHSPAQEDHTAEAEYHGVACHHVGKETDHQGEGLGEHTEQLNHWHQRNSFQEDGHIGPEDILPILLVAKQVNGQERAECQEDITPGRDPTNRSAQEAIDASGRAALYFASSSGVSFARVPPLTGSMMIMGIFRR